MPGLSLHVVIQFVNANAVYLSVSVFPCAMAHCVRIPMLKMLISDGLSPPLGLCLLAQSLWRESNDGAGQLAADDVASVWTLWIQSPLGPRQFGGFFVGYMPFPAAREKNNTNIYVCMGACVYVYIHIRMPACLSPCTCVTVSARMRQLWYCPIFTVRRITYNTNMLYAKTHFTIKGDIQKICLCVSMAACRKVCLAHLSAHMHLWFWCDLCDWWPCYECYYVYGICVLCTWNQTVTYTLNIKNTIVLTSWLGAGKTCNLIKFRF